MQRQHRTTISEKSLETFLKEAVYGVDEEYQRTYDWSTESVSDFVSHYLNTLAIEDAQHTFGSVTLYQGEDDDGDMVVNIVDGQHRIITAMLLLLSLYRRGSSDSQLLIRRTVLDNSPKVVSYYKAQRQELTDIHDAATDSRKRKEVVESKSGTIRQAFAEIERKVAEDIEAEDVDELVNIILDSKIAVQTFTDSGAAKRHFQIQNSSNSALRLADLVKIEFTKQDPRTAGGFTRFVETMGAVPTTDTARLRNTLFRYGTEVVVPDIIRTPYKAETFMEEIIRKKGLDMHEYLRSMNVVAEVFAGSLEGNNPFGQRSPTVLRLLPAFKKPNRTTVTRLYHLLLAATTEEEFKDLSEFAFYSQLYIQEVPATERVSKHDERRTYIKDALDRYKASGRKTASLYKGLRPIDRVNWENRHGVDPDAGYTHAPNNALILSALENHLAEINDSHPYYASPAHEVEHVISRKEARGTDIKVNSIGNLVLLPPMANRKANDDPYHMKRDRYLRSGSRLAVMFAEMFPTFGPEDIGTWEKHVDGMLYDLLKEKLRW